jgi:CubicO group peptidase (beta-lactamase class C family)
VSRVEQVRRRLDEQLSRSAAAHHVPGISVAVLVDEQVVEATAGVVNLRTGVPVTSDTLFMIQSITKVWTATLVMQLVDEGLVELDVPVREFLPEFRTLDERASRDITVRHLLSHTGGFEGDIWAATTAGEDALQRFVEDLVSRAPQHSRPGQMYSYCSAGYGVLGRLVEVTRQATFPVALRRYVADPLGIEEIAFSADEALAYRTAIGHVRPTRDAAQRPLKEWAVMPPSNPAAGNQLAMSARALIAFARMHLSDGRLDDGTQLLSASSAQAMREGQVDIPAAVGAPARQGLGWMLPNRRGLVEHGGGAPGVAALLRMVPEHGMAVAMLTNGGSPGRVADDLLEPMLNDMAGVAPVPGLPSPTTSGRVAESERYLGRFENRTTLLEVLRDDDGRLLLTESERNEALAMAEAAGVAVEPQRNELRRVSDDLFMLVDPSGVPIGAVEFVGEDASGRARILHTGRAASRVH